LPKTKTTCRREGEGARRKRGWKRKGGGKKSHSMSIRVVAGNVSLDGDVILGVRPVGED